jgi:signal transduction histidine kinase
MSADTQPSGRHLARHGHADSPSRTTGGAASGPRRLRPASLKDWRLRSRLILIAAIPVLLALVLGGVSVSSSARSEQGYQKVQQLADLVGDITKLVQALQNERQDAVTFISMAGQGGRASALSANPAQKSAAVSERLLLAADARHTGTWAALVRSLAATIGSAYPALTQQQAEGAITAIADLPALRQAAMGSKIPALTVIKYYGATITQLLTLESQVSVGSNNAALADNVRVLSLISDMKEEAAGQQAIVTSALRPDLVGADQLGAESLSVLNQDAARQEADLSDFDLTATDAQRQLYNSALSSPLAATAQQQLQQAESLLASGATSVSDPTLAVAAEDTSFITGSLGSIERQLMSSITGQSGSLRGRAAAAAAIEALVVLLLLALALLLIIVVARSMTRPLLRLRHGALDVAGTRLPEMVRQIGETDGGDVPLDVAPIDVDSADEIGEVARAFDQVHKEAVRLAANEAALRGNVNAMFVNLSRRSQSLVERLIRLISRLELGEQDSERLASLFQMDHLVTRLRRNSENLLVLAGHELSKRWSRPVALVDVLRAAVSEIERYERVTVDAQPGIAVRREAVNDVVHLAAELVENATAFSAASSPVTITANLLSSGGALIVITDQGVGMSTEDLAHVNWRLDNPPMVDVAVSRRMGLFVVGRLAARHGIRLRLRPVPSGGLSALVWLPDETITQEKTSPGRQHVVPEAGRDRAASPVALASPPRFAPLRADPDVASSDQRWSAHDPVQASEPRAVTGPLAETGRTLPPAGPPAGPAVGTGPGDVQAIQPCGDVLVPPADGTAEASELPIFEAVQSDWFRRGRQVVGKSGRGAIGWRSPSDEGWRAAEAVHAPSSDGVTTGGLPKRVPRANLIPGAVGASPAASAIPAPKAPRSAAERRERLTSFQRGHRRGRAAGSGEKPDGGKAGHHDEV